MIHPNTGSAANALLKTFGKVIKMSEGPLSGDTPTEKAAGKIIRPANTATSKSMTEICNADLKRLVWRLK